MAQAQAYCSKKVSLLCLWTLHKRFHVREVSSSRLQQILNKFHFSHVPCLEVRLKNLTLRRNTNACDLRIFDRSTLEESSRCVGCAIVKGDHAPDCGVAQGVVHGVTGHHGKKQEEEEGELEQEVERLEEENAQTPVRMCMDGMR